MPQFSRLAFVVASVAVVTLSGCNINSIVYRPDIHQGNLVTREMLEQLRIGMTRAQVQFILGEALIQSRFHQSRWDYTYYYNPRRGEIERRSVTVFFDENGRLKHVESAPLPSEIEVDRQIITRVNAQLKSATRIEGDPWWKIWGKNPAPIYTTSDTIGQAQPPADAQKQPTTETKSWWQFWKSEPTPVIVTEPSISTSAGQTDNELITIRKPSAPTSEQNADEKSWWQFWKSSDPVAETAPLPEETVGPAPHPGKSWWQFWKPEPTEKPAPVTIKQKVKTSEPIKADPNHDPLAQVDDWWPFW